MRLTIFFIFYKVQGLIFLSSHLKLRFALINPINLKHIFIVNVSFHHSVKDLSTYYSIVLIY